MKKEESTLVLYAREVPQVRKKDEKAVAVAPAVADPWNALAEKFLQSVSLSMGIQRGSKTLDTTEDDPFRIMALYEDFNKPPAKLMGIPKKWYSDKKLRREDMFQKCLWHCPKMQDRKKKGAGGQICQHNVKLPEGHVTTLTTGIVEMNRSVGVSTNMQWAEKTKDKGSGYIAMDLLSEESSGLLFDQLAMKAQDEADPEHTSYGCQLVGAGINGYINRFGTAFRVELWKKGPGSQVSLASKEKNQQVIMNANTKTAKMPGYPILFLNQLQSCCRLPALKEYGLMRDDTKLLKRVGAQTRNDPSGFITVPSNTTTTAMNDVDYVLRCKVPADSQFMSKLVSRGPPLPAATIAELKKLYPNSKNIQNAFTWEDGQLKWILPFVNVMSYVKQFMNVDSGLGTVLIKPNETLQLRLFPTKLEAMKYPAESSVESKRLAVASAALSDPALQIEFSMLVRFLYPKPQKEVKRVEYLMITATKDSKTGKKTTTVSKVEVEEDDEEEEDEEDDEEEDDEEDDAEAEAGNEEEGDEDEDEKEVEAIEKSKPEKDEEAEASAEAEKAEKAEEAEEADEEADEEAEDEE